MNENLHSALRGLRAPFEGARLLLQYPALWSLAWLPFGLGLLWAWSSFSAQEYFAEGGWLSWLAGSGLMLIVVSLQFFLALLSPLLDALSGRIEALCNPDHEPPAEDAFLAILRAIREGLLLLLWKLGLILVFLPLLIFDLGQWLWIPFSGFLIAVDFMDYPFSRRRLKLRERRALFRDHAPAVFVYSCLCHLLLLLPGWGGLLFLPCVLGGTWLVLPWLHTETTEIAPCAS